MANQNVLDALKVVTKALVGAAPVVQAEELTKENVKEGEYFTVESTGHIIFRRGEVIKLTHHDGTSLPYFMRKNGESEFPVELRRLRRATPDEVAKAFPNIKIIDGKTYEKVEKALEGDFIMFDKAPTSWLTAGKLYEVYDLDCGDAIIQDNDGDTYDTEDDDFTAYRLVAAQKKADDSFIEVDGLRYDKVEGAPRVGDYVIAIRDDWDITGNKSYEVVDLGGTSKNNAIVLDDAGDRNALSTISIKAVYRRELSEREESFVKFGRKVDEFKVGDLVQIIKAPTNGNGYNVVGGIHEVDGVTRDDVHLKHVTPRYAPGNTYTEHNDIKLVAPVERLS